MKHTFTVWGLLDAPNTSWVSVLILEERRNPGLQTGPKYSARPTDAIITQRIQQKLRRKVGEAAIQVCFPSDSFWGATASLSKPCSSLLCRRH